MAKYRVWYGDGPDYKKMSSLAEALKYFRKHDQLEEDESGLEENIDGEWDEWLDEDDQNVHEHLYMYGGKSAYLRVDEDDDDEFEDDEDIEEDDDDSDDGDMEDRLMNVIGGNARVKATEDNADEEDTFGDDEDDFDDDEDEDDFDDEEDEE